MKKEDKYGDRLRTVNFKPVHSRAINNLDYEEKLKVVEIEYKAGDIYHYENAGKKEWKKLLDVAKEKIGLGDYVRNQFRPKYDDEKNRKYAYYKLVIIFNPVD